MVGSGGNEGIGVGDGGKVWVTVGVYDGVTVSVDVLVLVGLNVVVGVHVGGRNLENVGVWVIIDGVDEQLIVSKSTNMLIENNFSRTRNFFEYIENSAFTTCIG